jgi:putative membrane protein
MGTQDDEVSQSTSSVPGESLDSSQTPVDTEPEAIPSTRASRAWVRVLPVLVVLVVILVFVVQNHHDVKVSFFSASGTLPLSVALIGSAVLGGLLVLALGSVRIFQLRRRVRRAATGRHHEDH